jgi:hypothetical protein
METKELTTVSEDMIVSTEELTAGLEEERIEVSTEIALLNMESPYRASKT